MAGSALGGIFAVSQGGRRRPRAEIKAVAAGAQHARRLFTRGLSGGLGVG